MAFDDTIRRKWQTIRALEADIEEAMVAFHRVTDGLGFAAVADMLEAKGWSKGEAAPAVKPQTPGYKLARRDVTPLVLAMAEKHNLLAAQIWARGRGLSDPARHARRAIWRQLADQGLSPAEIGRLFGRHRATVQRGLENNR